MRSYALQLTLQVLLCAIAWGQVQSLVDVVGNRCQGQVQLLLVQIPQCPCECRCAVCGVCVVLLL